MAYSHAHNLLGDPDLANDAAQESFIKVFQKINGFRGGSFRAWVLKIVTKTSFDLIRKAGRCSTQPLYPMIDDDEFESPAWIADPSASVEETIQQTEGNARLYRLLDELPVDYRSVVMLVDLHEFGYAETANALGIPLGTVKSRLVRARIKLRNKLQDRSRLEKFEPLLICQN